MISPAETVEIDEVGLKLTASLVPWDTEVFGFPVAQISRIRIDGVAAASVAWYSFDDWLAANDVSIVSCRLPMDCLEQSMFLETLGFRFVEVVLHPYVDQLDRLKLPADQVAVLPATPTDLSELTEIAKRAFRHERYHVDPRLDPTLGQARYGRWVRTSLDHASQRLLKITDSEILVGFFVVETDSSGNVYWHLTAISPDHQGKGYGRRAWNAMLNRHRKEGAKLVATTISVRNVAVQNLYAQLGFRFRPPEMTFHWVRGDS